MPGFPLTPSIRVSDMHKAIDFYHALLGFEINRGTPDEGNMSLKRGPSNIMIETAGAFYSPAYNDAIRQRLGTPSAHALYIEAEDLDDLYARVTASGIEVIDPLADREWGQAEFTVADPEGNWLTFYKALG